MIKRMVVGGVPNPIGGVTNFIYRMAERNYVDIIIDIYPSHTKRIPDSYKGDFISFKNVFSFILSLFFNKDIVKDVIHVNFNFSRPRSLFLFLLIRTRKEISFSLMLHHGSLKTRLPKFLISFLLRKFDRIYYLSKDQYDFYVSYLGDSSALKQSSSYIPVSKPSSHSVSDDFKQYLDDVGVYYLASGYCTPIYNHHWIIDGFIKNSSDKTLILFLYGQIDDDYLAIMKRKIGSHKNVRLIFNKSAEEFNYALSRSNGYIRPNSKDSFGIATADAVNFGVEVLASDVCRRYTGVCLFSPTNFETFSNALDTFLENPSALKRSLECPNSFLFHLS